MATEPLKAVFDTVVYLQAALNPAGPAFAALELADAGRIRLVASEETLEEVAEVLSRPRLRAKYPDLTKGVLNSRLLADNAVSLA
jgi:predicted nucleic acid-binding protein